MPVHYDPWNPDNTFGTASGDFNFLGSPTIEQTFEGRPAELWRAARMAQLPNTYQAFMPQFQRAAMSGFQPAFGRYLLSGQATPFGNFLSSVLKRSRKGGTDWAQGGAKLEGQWADAVRASGRLGIDPSTMESQMSPQAYGRELQYRGLLGSDNARANSIAMAMAGMGGSGGQFGGGMRSGYGGAARQRAIGNLYDAYATRAAAAGTPAGGFLKWLDQGMA
jgi:hypothetical protein